MHFGGALQSMTTQAASGPGDQLQYLHVPFAWVKQHWEKQNRPEPGPTIMFNATFGIVGRSEFVNVPAKITFGMTEGGRSTGGVNGADGLTTILPELEGGSAMISNGFHSKFDHHELVDCAHTYNVTTASGEHWSAPVKSRFVQPITTIRSDAHRTFDVDMCPSDIDTEQGDQHCCGYFDPTIGDALQVQRVPFKCRELLFKGDLYGYVYPQVDFSFTC